MIPPEYWMVALATAAVVVACVFIHYEGLRFIWAGLPIRRHDHHRRRIVSIILLLLVLHIVEIWIFGLTYAWLLSLDVYGALLGQPTIDFIDCIYFSASVYTTIGFGDIYPVGAIRLMAGTEGIAGLTMIAWSASYTFLEMGEIWKTNDD